MIAETLQRRARQRLGKELVLDLDLSRRGQPPPRDVQLDRLAPVQSIEVDAFQPRGALRHHQVDVLVRRELEHVVGQAEGLRQRPDRLPSTFVRALQQKSRWRHREGLHHEPTLGARHEMLSGSKQVVLRIVNTSDPESAGKADYPNAFPPDGETRRLIRREPDHLRSKFAHAPNPPVTH